METLLNTKQAATLLGVCPNTIARMKKERKLPFCVLGKSIRFKLEDIQAYVEKQRINAIDEEF